MAQLNPQTDPHFCIEILRSVKPPVTNEDGIVRQHVTYESGFSFNPELKDSKEPLKPGDRVRVFGNQGRGGLIRGFAVEEDGEVVRVLNYLTPREERLRAKAWQDERDQEKRDSYYANVEDYRERIAKLPEVFQDRLHRFEKHCGGDEWMIEFLPYELFVCEQAVELEGAITSDIDTFHALTWEEQKELVPGLDDDHSGNTFGSALTLAKIFRDKPELVPFQHAAIHIFVTCEKAGCFAARHERTGETLPA